MPAEDITLRTLEPDLLPAAHALSCSVGWPHRVEDWHFCLTLGRGFIALADGKPVGTALWWPYGNAHANIGLVIVSPNHQKRGIGRRLMNSVMREASPRSLMLNATQAGLPLYEELGFRKVGKIRQHQGTLRLDFVMAPSAGRDIRQATLSDLPALIALDTRATGLPRVKLLEALIAAGEIVILDRSGIAGYSVLRPFGRGSTIGPVVAPDAEAAWALIKHWFDGRAGAFSRVDLTDEHGLSAWLEASGLSHTGGAETMLRGEAPAGNFDTTLFALTSQALG